MDYKHLGYFITVCTVVFGAIILWWLKMFFTERKILKRIAMLTEEHPLSEEQK
ncbi:MAG: hypothetical protein ACE5EE_01045 [Fidelibacterota bacterium]